MNLSTLKIQNIKIKTRSALILAVLSMLACAPEGDLQRTIHPVSKRFADRQAPSTAPAAASDLSASPAALTVEALQSKGLPAACTTDSNKQLCIHCLSDHWAVERCYDFKGKFEADADCFHTNEHVKCLTKSPPFALYLDWRTSHEKFLRENFLVWQDTVHQIWDDKLLAADKEESDRLLKGLDWLTLTLSTRTHIEPGDGERWVNHLGLDTGSSKQGQDMLLSLQQTRLAGKLTLAALLDKVGEFYVRTHGASNLWEDLSTMSLEGLED